MADAVSAGRRPFFVNATAGTTVKGAFDPFDEIVPYGKTRVSARPHACRR